MPPSLAMKIRWPKPPLEHKQIWQQQPQQTEVWWWLLLRQILVLQKSGLCSIRNAVKSVDKEASTPHPEITVGRMATKLVALTRTSLANSQNPATNRRPLERITWEVVRQTENDVQGRHLSIIVQHLKSVEPHPFLNNMKHQ
jgi:hypothetical protein